MASDEPPDSTSSTVEVASRPPGPPADARLPPGRLVDLGALGRVFVRDTGPADPSTPPLVLLHGWSATSDINWLTSYDLFAERSRVIAMDHRGHGRGPRVAKRFRLQDAADDVVALLDAIGVESAVVVGYSMGGAVAQLLWRRHPERVAGMVLCATATEFRRSTLEHLVFASLTPTAAIARLLPPEFRRQTAVKIVTSRDDRDLRQWALAEIEHHDWLRVVEAGSEVGAFDSSRWAGSIDVPTAQVMTLDDRVVSLRRQHALHRTLADTTLHLVPGGHAVVMEDPDRFAPAAARAVDSVLTRLSTPGN